MHVYVHVYIYIYVCMFVYIYIYVYGIICLCIYIYTDGTISVCVYIYMGHRDIHFRTAFGSRLEPANVFDAVAATDAKEGTGRCKRIAIQGLRYESVGLHVKFI